MNFKTFVSLLILFRIFFNSSTIYAQGAGKKMNSKEINVLIDSLSKALRENYIYPEKAKLMVNGIRNSYKKGIYNQAKDRAELAQLLYDDIQMAHKDLHFKIFYNPIFAKHLETVVPEIQKQEEFQEGLKNERTENFWFKNSDLLPGNIGYVRWDGFTGYSEEAKSTINAAFRFVNNCNALIIDMRYNGGGAVNTVLEIQNYFFKDSIHLNDIIFRGRDTLQKWTDPHKTDFKLEMPVYILTSRFTFSGAEDFTYGMQHSKRAIVIGDTTGGGAHPVNSFSVGQGFVGVIPIGCAPPDQDWEAVGIRPDIAVPSDHALEKAKFMALSNCISAAANDMEKMKWTWQLNNLRADEYTGQIDVTTLKKYVGKYTGEMTFFMKDEKLYCKMGYKGDVPFKLKPISENYFVVNEDVQVKFEKDETGTITHLQMLWRDGWIEEQWKEPYHREEPKIVEVPETVLKKYEGVYMAPVPNKFTNIIKKEDGYYMYISGVYCKMYFTSETDFFHKEFNQEKHFKTDVFGNVIRYDRFAYGNLLSRHIKVLNPDTLNGSAILFNEIGWTFLENKYYAEAIRYLKRGMQLYPNDMLIEKNLAHCYLFTNEYNKALEIYKRSISKIISPGNSYASNIQQDFELFKTKGFPAKIMNKASAELNLREHTDAH